MQIKSLRLVGIHMAVYVKRRHLGNISNIESEYTRTGLGGFWVSSFVHGEMVEMVEVCGLKIVLKFQ